EVSGNRKRNEIWSKTLPELERVVADGGRVVKRLRGAIGNEIFDPLWDVAPEDARRRCIAYVAVAAIRTTKGGAEWGQPAVSPSSSSSTFSPLWGSAEPGGGPTPRWLSYVTAA